MFCLNHVTSKKKMHLFLRYFQNIYENGIKIYTLFLSFFRVNFNFFTSKKDLYKNTFYIQPEGENQVALSYNQRHAKEPRTVVYRLILGREARYAAEKHSDNDTGSGQSVVKGKRAISGWRP